MAYDYIGPPDAMARYLIQAAIESSGRWNHRFNRQLLEHYLDHDYVLPECRDRARRTIEHFSE